MASETRDIDKGPGAAPAEALWRLAPSADSDGNSLADFLLLVPGLGRETLLRRERVMTDVREACLAFGEKVIFVDINLRLSLVWVTVRAEQGLCHAVAEAIRSRVPEARLVGGQLPPRRHQPVLRRWMGMVVRARRAALSLLS